MANAARLSRGEVVLIMVSSFFKEVGIREIALRKTRADMSRLPKISTQLAFQFLLQTFRADDVDAGKLVAHDGQNLVRVGDGAGDDQAAILQFLLDLLPADELAAQKVVGCVPRHLEHDFGFMKV